MNRARARGGTFISIPKEDFFYVSGGNLLPRVRVTSATLPKMILTVVEGTRRLSSLDSDSVEGSTLHMRSALRCCDN